MTYPRLPRVRSGISATTCALMALALTAAAVAQTDTRATGRVVEGPANINDFAPEARETAVDATRVRLSQILADLGPVARSWYLHTTTLADPFFEGRVASTRGMELAGEYIAFYFDQYGLEPAFPDEDLGDDDASSWFQPFDINVREGPPVAAVHEARCSINDRELRSDEDFVVFGNSGSGEVSGPVTFVGYGIDEGPDGYSSFEAGADLTGRVALVFRYEPLDDEGRSRWADEGFSRHASLRAKLRRLADRGAAGIIVVTPPDTADGRTGLDSIDRSSQFGAALPVPVVQITAAVADDLLIQADPGSRDLMTFRRLADEGAIGTLALEDAYRVNIAADVERRVNTRALAGRNVGGVLPGRGDLAEEWLVITGHYDHVGIGQFSGTRPGNRGQVHPGADDNASGTAGVMVLAQRLAEAYASAPANAPRRSVLFLAFDGEERGLLGSKHFVAHPTINLAQVTANLNFDMIGQLRDDHLLVLGSQTARGLEDILKPHIEASGLTVALSPGSSGRSDEASFIDAGVPGLHFFTGMTPDYHAPTDTFDKINPAGAARILELAFALAEDLVSRPAKLAFTEPGRARTEDRAYAAVRLGIRPGMGADLETGVLVEGVSLDTSAADAGIREGDVILSWNGTELTSVRDLFEQLQKHKPGDVVKMEIRRDGQVITIDVTMKAGDP